MDGGIAPLEPLLARVRIGEDGEEKPHPARILSEASPSADADQRGLKLSQDDLAAFSDHIRAAYAELARDYYLEPEVRPEVKVGKDAIRISIPVQKLR